MNKTTPFNIFSIVSEPRTGSNFLVSVLTSNKNIVCHAEVFHPDKIYIKLPKDEIPGKQERDLNPVNFLNTVMQLTYEKYDNPELIGFKYFFDHNSKIMDHIITERIPVILLERLDKLAQYSSAKIANKTDQWTSKQQSEQPNQDRRVRFSLLQYIAFILRSKYRFYQAIKTLDKNKADYIHIYYEDIVKENGVTGIYEFLNIDSTAELTDHVHKK